MEVRRQRRARTEQRDFCASALLSALLLAPALAGAEPPALRLSYTRGEGAASCPDEQALRESVAARLGYDPFRADAEGAVSATLSRGPRGLRAVVELRDRSGRVTGSRLLTTARKDCRELASAMALAICIAVDPLVLTRALPPKESPPPPPPPPPPPCPSCPLCPPPPRAPVRFRAGVGAQLDVGAVPTLASLGVVAQAELRHRAFALALEGRVDPELGSARASSDGGGVGATLLLALLVPCARLRSFGLCALLGMGALKGRGVDLAMAGHDTTFYAAAGARLSYEIPLLPQRLALDLHLDGLAPLTRTGLRIDGAEVWATPPIAGSLGAILQVLIP